MVEPGGKVVGIEHLPELAELSRKNLEKDPEHKKMLEDGRLKGYPEEGIYLDWVD
jgi:Protein-L-isoaspartate(D-aspartate) O-methyltransferase (PCMT)